MADIFSALIEMIDGCEWLSVFDLTKLVAQCYIYRWHNRFIPSVLQEYEIDTTIHADFQMTYRVTISPNSSMSRLHAQSLKEERQVYSHQIHRAR